MTSLCLKFSFHLKLNLFGLQIWAIRRKSLQSNIVLDYKLLSQNADLKI